MGTIQLLQSCPTLAAPWIRACQASLWDFPGKDTGVGAISLLQAAKHPTGQAPPPLPRMIWSKMSVIPSLGVLGRETETQKV